MTQTPEKVDQQWLNALAGKPDTDADADADAETNLQAAALRSALKARSNLLGSNVPTADDAQYQKLMFRLRREGLSSSEFGWKNPMFWSLAATVVLGVGVVIQMGGLQQNEDEANILRGDNNSTVLVVTEPDVRMKELQAGFKSAGEEPSIKREADGRIVLKVKATEKVLDYLAQQRIEPLVTDGSITLTLMSVNSSVK